MASGDLTLVDLIKQTKDDVFLPVVETMTEEFQPIEDMVWVQANGMTNHTYMQEASLPAGQYTTFNVGVAAEKAQYKQLVEEVTFLEALAKTDDRIIRISGNKQKVRSNQDMGFIKGLTQTFADSFFNAANSGIRMNGLRGRLDSLGTYVKDGGGAANRTSLFFVQWGETKVHMIYPGGWKHAIEAKDKGLQLVPDASGNLYDAWVTLYKFAHGLCIENEKNIARIANIDSTQDIVTSNVDDLMIEVLNAMPGRGKGVVIYADNSMLTQFDVAVKDKVNGAYGVVDAFGQPVTSFLMHPIKLAEAIGNSEAAVV